MVHLHFMFAAASTRNQHTHTHTDEKIKTSDSSHFDMAKICLFISRRTYFMCSIFGQPFTHKCMLAFLLCLRGSRQYSSPPHNLDTKEPLKGGLSKYNLLFVWNLILVNYGVWVHKMRKMYGPIKQWSERQSNAIRALAPLISGSRTVASRAIYRALDASRARTIVRMAKVVSAPNWNRRRRDSRRASLITRRFAINGYASANKHKFICKMVPTRCVTSLCRAPFSVGQTPFSSRCDGPVHSSTLFACQNWPKSSSFLLCF